MKYTIKQLKAHAKRARMPFDEYAVYIINGLTENLPYESCAHCGGSKWARNERGEFVECPICKPEKI